jgi:hypothetical protein
MVRKTLILMMAPAALHVAAGAAEAQYALTWTTIDGGGATTPATGGNFTLAGTVGQPDAGSSGGGTFACVSGFWGAALGGAGCYANCDGSTGVPRLTANDFQCFINAFAAGQSYANCDGSTGSPALTANDFQCFINAFAGGCS